MFSGTKSSPEFLGTHLPNLEKVKQMPPMVPNLLKDSKLYKEHDGVKTHLPLKRSGEALIY